MSLLGHWKFAGQPQTNLVSDQVGNMDITHAGGNGAGWWRDSPDYALAGADASWSFTPDLANRPDPTSHTDLSFCFAIKALSSPRKSTCIFPFNGSASGGYKGWSIALNMSSGAIQCIDSAALWNGTSWQTFPNTNNVFPSVADQRLNYYGVVINMTQGGNAEAFIDGQSLGTVTTGTFSHDTTAATRKWGQNYSYIDNIQYHDRLLTATEIQAHAYGPRTWMPSVGLGDEKLWLCPSINNSPNDISGNGNNGVYQGGMGTVTDVSNGGSLAYDFDGTDDYISNSSLSLAGLTEFSYSGWLNASTSSGHRAIFSHGDNFDYDDDIYILNNSSNFQAEVNNGSPVGGNGSASLPALNTWHHIAVVFDGSGATNADRLRYFLNGVEVTLTYNYTVPTSTSSVSPMNTEIGSFASYGALHFWQGKQDDIRVYDRVLTQSEITHLATSRGIEGPPPVGLGGETMWICPSLDQSSTTKELTGAGLTITEEIYGAGTIAIVADTAEGGTHALEFVRDTSHNVLAIDNFGNTYAEASTVAFWVKNDGNVMRLMGLNSPSFWPSVSSGRFFYETWYGATARGYMYDPSGGTNGWSDTADVNLWTHITMVREGTGGKKRLYYNGVLDDQEYDDAGRVTSGLSMLFGIGGGSSNVVGSKAYLDDMRTYGRALTQSEITHLASQRGVLGAPTLSTRYYDFGPSSSPVKSGYQQVTEAAYDSNLFGWGFSETSGTAVNSYDRNWGTDDMERDFCYQSIARIFRDPTVIAGDYTIKAYCGDLGYTRDLYIDVWNGSAWVDTTIQMNSVPSGTIQTATADITVGDNGVAGLYIRTRNVTSSNWVICGLDLTPAGGGPPATTQYNAFATHAFTQLFQQRLR